MYSSRTWPKPASGAAAPACTLLRKTRSLPTAGWAFRPRALRRSMRRWRAISFFSRAVGPRRTRCAGIDFRFGAVRGAEGGTCADEVSSLPAGAGEVASLLLLRLSRELATPVDEPEDDHEAGEFNRDRVRGCSFSLSFSSRSSKIKGESSCAAAGESLDG